MSWGFARGKALGFIVEDIVSGKGSLPVVKLFMLWLALEEKKFRLVIEDTIKLL